MLSNPKQHSDPNSNELLLLRKKKLYLDAINEIKNEIHRFEGKLNRLEEKIKSGELRIITNDDEKITGDKDRAALKRRSLDLSRVLVEFRKVKFT